MLRGGEHYMDNDTKLADALNDHQITDENGEITPEENSATPEETPVEETATAEKSAETAETVPTATKETENEPELVETAADETGKRYVPENRFKEVYAKMKRSERELEDMRRNVQPQQPKVERTEPLNKADALEIELLRSTLPQFNPESTEYSRDIDELGFSIYESSRDKKGNYTMTRLEAGRKAMTLARNLTSKVVESKTEARTVKAQQSDQGITTRVLKRDQGELDPDKMSLEEKEAWLKANNLW
jgi:hypothetical protein